MTNCAGVNESLSTAFDMYAALPRGTCTLTATSVHGLAPPLSAQIAEFICCTYHMQYRALPLLFPAQTPLSPHAAFIMVSGVDSVCGVADGPLFCTTFSLALIVCDVLATPLPLLFEAGLFLQFSSITEGIILTLQCFQWGKKVATTHSITCCAT